MVDSIRKSKVLDVRGFELLRFDARMDARNHWLEVHTKLGERPDDEWIEFLGGIKGKKGTKFHMGKNKDGTHRFLKRRGVLKSISQRVENADTHEVLDATEDSWGIADSRFAVYWGLSSNKTRKIVWVSNLKLARKDQTSEFDR